MLDPLIIRSWERCRRFGLQECGLNPQELFAWASYLLFRPYFDELQLLWLFGFAYLAGIWFIDVAGRALHDPDHGCIVWDEIVPFWLVLLLTPDNGFWQAAAFALFRLFDISEIYPATHMEIAAALERGVWRRRSQGSADGSGADASECGHRDDERYAARGKGFASRAGPAA